MQQVGVELLADNKNQFLRDMDSASRAVSVFGETAGKTASGLSKIGESAFKVGSDIAKLGVAAGAAGGALSVAFATKAVSAFGDFEAAMLQTKSVSNDWTAEMGTKLENLALQLGADLPISAKDAALGFSELAKAGLALDDVYGAGEGLAKLAVAGQLDMARSAEILGAALTSFQLPAEKALHVSDLLAQTANASAVSVDDLGMTFKYIGSAAASAGFSIEDMSIAIGLMGAVGVKADQSGTTLRSTITRLAAPPKDAAYALDQLGVSAFNAAGKSRPFRDIMVELQGKFKGLSEQQAVQYGKMIAGQEAMSGFLALVQSSPEDFEKMRSAIDGADGASQKMADTLSEGVSGAMGAFEGATESFLIRAGRPLGAVMADLIKKAADVIDRLSPLGELFGTKLAQSIDATVTALDKIDWSAIIEKGKPILDTIISISSALNPLAIGIELLSGVLSGDVDKSLANIGERFGKVGGLVESLAPKIIDSGAILLTKLITWIGDKAPEVLQGALVWGTKIVEGVASKLPDILIELGKTALSIGNWVISEGVPFLFDKFQAWGNELVAWIEPKLPLLGNELGRVGELILNKAGELAPKLIEKFAEWGKELVGWVIKAAPILLQEFSAATGNLIDSIAKKAPEIGDKLKEWGGAFVGWIKNDVVPNIGASLSQVVSTILTWIVNNTPKIIAAGAMIAGKILEGFGNEIKKIPILGTFAGGAMELGGQALQGTGHLVGGGLQNNQRRAELQGQFDRALNVNAGYLKAGTINQQQYDAALTTWTEWLNKEMAKIPAYASGTNWASGGWSLVGERGPELVNLPYGSQVIPHAMSAQAIGQMGNNYTYNYNGGNNYQASMSMPANSSPHAFQLGFEQFYTMNKVG